MNKYYESKTGEWFVDPILANHSNLNKRTELQYQDWLKESRVPTPERLLAGLTDARKEQERQGVTINGIRYGGEPENRQALSEASEYMADAGLTKFPKWKDSDDVFHTDHPLSDVVDAYRAIGALRAQLIAAEGEYAAQVVDGSLTEVTGLTWPQ